MIKSGENEKMYGCYCDLEPNQKPDGCVIDTDERFNCRYAEEGLKKEDCQYWRPVYLCPHCGQMMEVKIFFDELNEEVPAENNHHSGGWCYDCRVSRTARER